MNAEVPGKRFERFVLVGPVPPSAWRNPIPELMFSSRSGGRMSLTMWWRPIPRRRSWVPLTFSMRSVVNRVPVSQREPSILGVLLERSAYADPSVGNCTHESRWVPFVELHQSVCAYWGLRVLNSVVPKFRERYCNVSMDIDRTEIADPSRFSITAFSNSSTFDIEVQLCDWQHSVATDR